MHLMRSIILMVVLAAFLRAQPAVVAPESLDVPQLLEDHHVPAVSVALIHDSKIARARAWGVKDAGTGEPATVDTLFQAP